MEIKRLNDFVAEFDIAVVSLGKEIAEVYAKIVLDLKSKGRPIPTNDIWIAAAALYFKAHLLTDDRHCKEVKGLKQLPVRQQNY